MWNLQSARQRPAQLTQALCFSAKNRLIDFPAATTFLLSAPPGSVPAQPRPAPVERAEGSSLQPAPALSLYTAANLRWWAKCLVSVVVVEDCVTVWLVFKLVSKNITYLHCPLLCRCTEQGTVNSYLFIYTGRGVELAGIIMSEVCSAVSSPFLLWFCLVPFALYTLHAA